MSYKVRYRRRGPTADVNLLVIAMTDSVERLRGVPNGAFVSEEFLEESGGARDTVPDVHPRSYIDELRQRVDLLPDDEEALTVPPNASFQPWVAGDLSAALQAAAEIIPRAPSSPEDPRLASTVAAPELSARQLRRKRDESVPDFPVELRESDAPTLRTRDRGRTSGRFVLPTDLRAPSSDEGPIARALKQLVHDERAHAPLGAASDEAVSDIAVSKAAPASDEQGPNESAAFGSTFSVALVVFAAASVAGAAMVYAVLHG